jgi:hypothetical protein
MQDPPWTTPLALGMGPTERRDDTLAERVLGPTLRWAFG